MSVLSDLGGRVPHARNRSIRLVNAVLVAALLALGGIAYAVTRTRPAATQPTVRTATVSRGVVLSSVSACGTIASPSDLDVGFETAGLVQEIDVESRQRVTKGEVLARLDPTSDQSAVAQAAASLASARANLVAARAGETAAQRQADAVSVKQGEAQIRQANVAVANTRLPRTADRQSAAEVLKQARSTTAIG
jgi:multidrug efflux pump subunit AcrA (membrane-fusion protein)